MQLMALRHGFTSLQTSSSNFEMNMISVPLHVTFADSSPNYVILYTAPADLAPSLVWYSSSYSTHLTCSRVAQATLDRIS
jgi:hypothetical protein